MKTQIKEEEWSLIVDYYVQQQLPVRKVKQLLHENHNVRIPREAIRSRLRNEGLIRKNGETFTGKKRVGNKKKTCAIPGCANVFLTCSSTKYCRTCIPGPHANRLWVAWKMTWPQFEALLLAQDKKCAGCHCLLTFDSKKSPTTSCIDHDHLTGKIRGLLCHRCNTALGHVSDSIETLQALIDYLRNNQK